MDSWAEGPMAGFDTETTGRDSATARLVTATVTIHTPGDDPEMHNWMVAVDEPIPAEATAIHGVSTEQSQSDGEPLSKVVTEIHGLLVASWEDEIPVVVYNATYDWTVLNRERFRSGMRPLRFSETTTPILDPLVIDRAVDRHRRGKRTLSDACAHYGVTLDNAHTSTADACAAVGVMRAVAVAFPEIRQMSLARLYEQQRVWHSAWAANLESYQRSCKSAEGAPSEVVKAIVVDRSWPVVALDPGVV